jgi:hypothetical protein
MKKYFRSSAQDDSGDSVEKEAVTGAKPSALLERLFSLFDTAAAGSVTHNEFLNAVALILKGGG